MMKSYLAFFLHIVIISSLAGCKLDTPIYPSNTDTTAVTGTTGTDTTGTTTGTGTTGTTSGLVDNGSTITYTINGNTTVLNYVAFQVVQPNALTYPSGNTQLIGGIDKSGGFSLTFSSNKTGNYSIDLLFLGNYTGSGGDISITTLTTTDGSHGTIIGTFATTLTDITTKAIVKGVTGTFNIKI